ncbi:DUF4097 family beta strand repeat-containing protein [Gracilibacillus sp. HCP3S3_G5_1]|uniref:DUF4097 family beta strand repeat-containing protein n=1 Tax=unclassified Gracilibacillus TaxID=2625209 RepID=UPI003F8A7704
MNVKRIVIFACALLLVGGIGSLLSYRFYEPEPLSVTEELDNGEIDSVEIQVHNEQVNIVPTTDPTPKVELIGTEDGHTETELVVDEQDNTLSISTENKRRKWFSFHFFELSRTLTVYLPEQEYQRLAVEISNGSLQVGSLNVNEVDIKTNNGKLELFDIVADHYQLRTNNGGMQLENIDGELVARTDNGSISLVTEDLDRNIDLETDNGRIKIHSKKEPTNTIFDTNVDNGRVNLFDDANYNKVIGDGDNLVKLSTKNGSITVTQ